MSMRFSRSFGIILLMFWTMAVTVCRGWRTPNDFAEAHWLLDYRLGFIKRGLIGEVLSLTTDYFTVPITAQLIATLATVALLIYGLTLIALSMRIVYKLHGSDLAVMLALVFLASPFTVMSAHLNGYYDNIVIVLGVGSIALLLKRYIWLAVGFQIVALLIHENTLLLTFPPLCWAWWLINRQSQTLPMPRLSILPLLLPVVVFIGLALYQSQLMTQNLIRAYTEHLARFPFIQADKRAVVPLWIYSPFIEHLASRKTAIFSSETVSGVHLILPMLLSLLYFLVKTFRLSLLSLEFMGVLLICLMPQGLHLIAWDTARIWTYSIMSSFFMLWIYTELGIVKQPVLKGRLIGMIAFVAHVVLVTPLMDDAHDALSLNLRWILYLPVIVGVLCLGAPSTQWLRFKA